MDVSILAKLGSCITWIFAPLGWGNWQAVVASITGLVAKENIVGTMGVLYGGDEAWTALAEAFTTSSWYVIPDFQPFVCSLFCSNRCYQARNEQQKMDLGCNRLAVWTCLCSFICCLPARFNLCRQR